MKIVDGKNNEKNLDYTMLNKVRRGNQIGEEYVKMVQEKKDEPDKEKNILPIKKEKKSIFAKLKIGIAIALASVASVFGVTKAQNFLENNKTERVIDLDENNKNSKISINKTNNNPVEVSIEKNDKGYIDSLKVVIDGKSVNENELQVNENINEQVKKELSELNTADKVLDALKSLYVKQYNKINNTNISIDDIELTKRKRALFA